MNALIFALVELLHTVIEIYIWIIIISVVLSYIRPNPSHQIARQILQVIDQLTQPPLDLIKKKMPFVMSSGMDFSPIVLLLGLKFLDTFIMKLSFG
jgi:YggT family protein